MSVIVSIINCRFMAKQMSIKTPGRWSGAPGFCWVPALVMTKIFLKAQVIISGLGKQTANWSAVNKGQKQVNSTLAQHPEAFAVWSYSTWENKWFSSPPALYISDKVNGSQQKEGERAHTRHIRQRPGRRWKKKSNKTKQTVSGTLQRRAARCKWSVSGAAWTWV